MRKLKIMLFAFICFFAVGIVNANAYVWIGGAELKDGATLNGSKTGTISWDESTKTLTLNNYNQGNYIPSGDAVIHIDEYTTGDVTVVLKGENNIRTASCEEYGWGMGIFADKANLIFKSSTNETASLKVNGGDYAIKANSISFDNLSLNIMADSYAFNVTPTITNLGSEKVYVSTSTNGTNPSIYTTGELTSYKNVTTYTTYNVTVDADENSIVSLTDNNYVIKAGESTEATISAKEGYKLISVLVDGVEKLPLTDGKITLSKINADTTIKVVSAIDDITVDVPEVDTTKEVKKVEVGVKKETTLKENMKKSIEDEEINISNIDTLVKVNISELNKENIVEEELENINNLAKKEKLNILSYFDISVAVINKSNNEIISLLSDLNKPMTFQVVLPSESINTNKNIKRTYYIIRYHNNTAEIIDAKLNNNILTFASDKFSTYAIAYNDTAIKTNDNVISNPNTGDNMITYAMTSVLCVSGLLGSGIVLKKRFN